MKNNLLNISLSDTSVMKGIAIIAMLCHHTFTCRPSFEAEYPAFLTTIGILGKVCVAMFLFCSGYGLSEQYGRGINSINHIKDKILYSVKFIIKRLIKFYSAYWFVFFIFVPLGIFVFDRSLPEAYGESVIYLQRLIYDIFGIGGFISYNVTWWFNKLIILFYIVFPIIFIIIKHTKLLGFILCFLLMRFANKLSVLNYYEILLWQFPFIVGIYYSNYKEKLNKLSECVREYKIISFVCVLVVFMFCILQRLYAIIPWGHITGIRMDTFLTLSILLISLLYMRNIPWLYKPLSILGNHSMNIYLIHTFFNHYWELSRKLLHDSYLRVGGVNVVVLLLLCLVLSIIIEWLKEKIYWNKISLLLINIVNRNKL